jgi:hypothetical protein
LQEKAMQAIPTGQRNCPIRIHGTAFMREKQ